MVRLVSTCTWRDLSDRHLYHEGDLFPFDGREVPEDRLTALMSGQNMAELALIRAEEVQDEPEEGTQQEAPEEAKEAEKTATVETAEPAQEKKPAQAKAQTRSTKRKSK